VTEHRVTYKQVTYKLYSNSVCLRLHIGSDKISKAAGCALCKLRLTLYTSYVLRLIQGVPRLVDITAGGNFLGLCDQKSSYKHVSDFGRLRSYDRLKLRREGNDY